MTKREHFLERVLLLQGNINKALYFEDLNSIITNCKRLLNEVNEYKDEIGEYETVEFNERFN